MAEPTQENKGSGTKELVIEVLKSCFDPEIPVDIYTMGLIYEVQVYPPGNNVHILMTLTSPSCPVAESLPVEVEDRVRSIEGVDQVKVELTWEPPWTMDMMSEAAKLELGFL